MFSASQQLSLQAAKHFRGVFNGGNWTSVNLKDTLEGVDYKQATRRVQSFNNIAMLVFHINYYLEALNCVFEQRLFNFNDKFSFDVPDINSAKEWKELIRKVFENAERAAGFIEKLPEEKFFETFADEKYGSYFRNIFGTIEHTHYHLGQIVILKKILNSNE
jgi:hypothetical protein